MAIKQVKCGKCGSTVVTMIHATVFNRFSEDSIHGLRVDVDLKKGVASISQNAHIDNPSSRRDGVKMWVKCEACGKASTLTVANNKGQLDAEVL